MKRLLCVALLSAVGCTSVPTSAEPPVAAPKEHGIQVWVPGFFADLWETFDARIAMDYGFGAHLKFTDLARIGIFDYSDFSLLGIDRDIFYGRMHWPHREGWHMQTSYDLAVKVGVGLGAEAAIHPYEIVDWLCWTFTAGYYRPSTD